MKRMAILISNAGTGTNLQAIIDGIEQKKINGTINVVISDTSDAQGLTRATTHHLPTHILKSGENLTQLLTTTYPVDFIALAGWKKIIPDDFIDDFPNKLLNLHPGVIPDVYEGEALNPDHTPGVWNRGKFTNAAIANFLEQKATYAGSTIHFLTKQFDFGPVLGRCFEKTLPGDTVESLYGRLKVKENALYSEVLSKVCA